MELEPSDCQLLRTFMIQPLNHYRPYVRTTLAFWSHDSHMTTNSHMTTSLDSHMTTTWSHAPSTWALTGHMTVTWPSCSCHMSPSLVTWAPPWSHDSHMTHLLPCVSVLLLCPHTVEFALPFSCSVAAAGQDKADEGIQIIVDNDTVTRTWDRHVTGTADSDKQQPLMCTYTATCYTPSIQYTVFIDCTVHTVSVYSKWWNVYSKARASGRNVGKVFNPVLKLVFENYPFLNTYILQYNIDPATMVTSI